MKFYLHTCVGFYPVRVLALLIKPAYYSHESHDTPVLTNCDYTLGVSTIEKKLRSKFPQFPVIQVPYQRSVSTIWPVSKIHQGLVSGLFSVSAKNPRRARIRIFLPFNPSGRIQVDRIRIDQVLQSRTWLSLDHRIDQIEISVNSFYFHDFTTFVWLMKTHNVDHETFFLCVF